MSNIQYSLQRYSFFLICANLFLVVQLIYRIVPLFTPLSPFHFPFSVFTFQFSVFTGLVESPERDREFLSPFGRTIGFAVRSSVRGPRKFAICGESGGCCRSNDRVILCDLHTERDVQFVGIVVIKNGIYIPVDTSCYSRHIYLRFSRMSIAQGDVRRRLQFITEYAVCYRSHCNKIY